ncbi:hypothetical protein [Brevundimonas sp.]|uniref:hypothetical protein n=1 Tax=Brevundimonas sp. TaxID=1871086 RepID=UPI002897E90F|nr:hypothetical protein [Brevundimonas sp.]
MTMMTSKYRALVEKLLDRTNSKLIEWRYDVHSDACRANIGSKVVELKMGRNEIEEPIAIVKIINSSGDIVDSFTDETISGAQPKGYDSYWALMQALFSSAKNQALGVGKDVDELLEELDDILPF